MAHFLLFTWFLLSLTTFQNLLCFTFCLNISHQGSPVSLQRKFLMEFVGSFELQEVFVIVLFKKQKLPEAISFDKSDCKMQSSLLILTKNELDCT